MCYVYLHRSHPLHILPTLSSHPLHRFFISGAQVCYLSRYLQESYWAELRTQLLPGADRAQLVGEGEVRLFSARPLRPFTPPSFPPSPFIPLTRPSLTLLQECIVGQRACPMCRHPISRTRLDKPQTNHTLDSVVSLYRSLEVVLIADISLP